MQITLRQADIEQSLKDYITSQGIRTEGKEVHISFTSSRKGAGITAEVTIGEAALQPKAPQLSVVEDVKITSCEGVVQEPSNAPESVEEVPEPAPVKTTSLFG